MREYGLCRCGHFREAHINNDSCSHDFCDCLAFEDTSKNVEKKFDPKPILADIVDGLLKLEMVKRVTIEKVDFNAQDYNILCYFSNNKVFKYRLSRLEMEHAIFDVGEVILENFYRAILAEEKRIY